MPPSVGGEIIVKFGRDVHIVLTENFFGQERHGSPLLFGIDRDKRGPFVRIPFEIPIDVNTADVPNRNVGRLHFGKEQHIESGQQFVVTFALFDRSGIKIFKDLIDQFNT